MISWQDSNGSSSQEVGKESDKLSPLSTSPQPTVTSILTTPLPNMQKLELVADGPRPRNASALGSFMIHLLNDAIVISDRHNDSDDAAGKKGMKDATDEDSDIDSVSETTPDAACKPAIPQNEFIVISDNARLPFQESSHQLKLTSPRPERRYSERAEMKRETRWSSLNQSNPNSAGLTLPLRSKPRTSSFDYSNLPMPKSLQRRSESSEGKISPPPRPPKSPSPSQKKKTLSNDTIPTYPRYQSRRSSA